jgi:hypothetical protein
MARRRTSSKSTSRSASSSRPHTSDNERAWRGRRQALSLSPLSNHHPTWKFAEAWVCWVDGVFSSINVYELLPAGITKITSPVVPDEPAGKPSASVVSVVGALVVPPAFSRI